MPRRGWYQGKSEIPENPDHGSDLRTLLIFVFALGHWLRRFCSILSEEDAKKVVRAFVAGLWGKPTNPELP